MKHIFLNLKRFDIPKEYGGVNSIAPIGEWGSFIVSNTQEQLKNMPVKTWNLPCIFRRPT